MYIFRRVFIVDQSNSNQKWIYPAPASEQTTFQNSVKNSFLHQFSHPNDTRRSFPSFSRNISISTGNVNEDYNSEYTLTPGKLLFEQDAIVAGILPAFKNRRLRASQHADLSRILWNKVTTYLVFPIVTRNRDYRTMGALEFDMASGGYKDEFYDKFPTGAVSILRLTGNFWGNKYYNNHMMFLPTTSALAINPNIWENHGNLFYDIKANNLMFKSWIDLQNNLKSNTYGYPNLGRPTDHFSVTPFESIYCDPQTYEHIKMQASIDDNAGYNDSYLVAIRDYILNEVEADIVCLQNKTIGKNHIQTPEYNYPAWYKAYDQILIGNLVSPNTDPGDYIIESTGEITVHAGNSITISPGFHTQNGSEFHAYIYYDGCSRPR